MTMSTNPSATKSADSLRVSSRSSGVAQRTRLLARQVEGPGPLAQQIGAALHVPDAPHLLGLTGMGAVRGEIVVAGRLRPAEAPFQPVTGVQGRLLGRPLEDRPLALVVP